jgi:hypothetical protein
LGLVPAGRSVTWWRIWRLRRGLGGWAFGRPPTDEETAAQIARFASSEVAEILGTWSAAAAQLDHMAETAGVEPPLGDITSHEHDVRAAIGRPGARDSAAVW